VVAPEGLSLAYEVFAGNRADVTTVGEIVETMEIKYGVAQRIWILDRGMVSEAAGESFFSEELIEGHDFRTVNGWFTALATNLLPDDDEAFTRAEARGFRRYRTNRLRFGAGTSNP
jgi:hypothetical protein